MNRELKFRAWDKVHKVMLPVTAIDFEEKLCSWGNELLSSRSWATMDSLELMQFTGLLDKNGKEIYEGDIVSGLYNRYPSKWVVNELSAFGITFNRITIEPKPHLTFYKDMRHTEKWEVIGNIFENKELLKE